MPTQLMKNIYTIEDVAEIADVSSFTLRNWEERYSLFSPDRDANGRRVFTERDTLRAICASELVKRDYKIGKVAQELVESADPYSVLSRYLESDHFLEIRQNALEGLLAYDSHPFRMTFDQLIANFSIEFLADHFFYPVFRQVEDMLVLQTITEFQAKFVHQHLASRLHRLIGLVELNRNSRNGKKIIVSGLPGNRYEDSLLILYLILEFQGWQVFYGGMETSIEEFASAVAGTGAQAAILVGNNLNIAEYDQYEPILSRLAIPIELGGKLALKLLAQNRTAPANIEWSRFRPGPLAKLMNYKVL